MKDIQLINVSLPLLNTEKLYTILIQNGMYTKVEPQTQKRNGNFSVFKDIWSSKEDYQPIIDMGEEFFFPLLLISIPILIKHSL
ncbi:hypothetical protein AAHH67_04575 [Niallia circulans]